MGFEFLTSEYQAFIEWILDGMNFNLLLTNNNYFHPYITSSHKQIPLKTFLFLLFKGLFKRRLKFLSYFQWTFL